MTRPPDHEIAAWVIAARTGDPSAFAALHARAAPVVRAVVMARSGPHDLEDRVHDVFVIALDRLDQLSEPHAFLPWIAQIARRHAGRRTRPSWIPVPLPDSLGTDDSPRAEAERVLGRITALPECYAEPLTLRLVFGMSGAEIAETLGLSPAYVRVNLHRGLRRLRESMGLDARGRALEPTMSARTQPGTAPGTAPGKETPR